MEHGWKIMRFHDLVAALLLLFLRRLVSCYQVIFWGNLFQSRARDSKRYFVSPLVDRFPGSFRITARA